MKVKSLVLLVAVLTLVGSLGAPNADAAKKAVKKPADVKAAQGAVPAASPPAKEPAPAATPTEPAKKSAPAAAADSAAPKHFTFVVNKTGTTLWVQIKDTYLRTPVAPNGVYTVARDAEMTLSANDGKTATKKATQPEMRVVATDLSTPTPVANANGLKQVWDKFAKFTAAYNKTASE